MDFCARIALLIEKLEDLRRRDRRLRGFGADEHRYRIGKPLSFGALCRFEEQYRIHIPEEYRAWLLTVGQGGAGPSYGLIPLPKAAKRNPQTQMSRPFPFSTAQGNAIRKKRKTDRYASIPGWSIDGVLSLAGHGCGWESALVLDGEEAGTVWYGGDGWWPEQSHNDTTKIRLSYFDWYEDWLDRSAG